MSQRDARTTLNYIQWQDKYNYERPYDISSGAYTGSVAKTNVVIGKGKGIVISDARGTEALFQLDSHGFAFRQLSEDQCKFQDFLDKTSVIEQFIPGIVKPFILQNVPEAEGVFVFDWHLRSSDPSKTSGFIDMNDGTQPYTPATQVHVGEYAIRTILHQLSARDQTPTSAIRRVRRHMGNESSELLRSRVRIVNFWKPIFNKVSSAPLAVCDGSTVRKEDCVVIDLVKATGAHAGDFMMLLETEAQRWYYLSEQQPSEVTLMKIFDSDTRTAARCCPHTSFDPVDVPADSLPRQSIEVRALVFG